MIQGQRLLPFCGSNIPCGHLNPDGREQKGIGDEECMTILFTFHWLELMPMAIPNCKRAWKMWPSCVSRKKIRILEAGSNL